MRVFTRDVTAVRPARSQFYVYSRGTLQPVPGDGGDSQVVASVDHVVAALLGAELVHVPGALLLLDAAYAPA